MPPDRRLRHVERLSDIAADAWDALTGGQACLAHAFLSALEDTGCVGAGTGWRPCHLILREHERVIGALPLYAKDHSYGEYVFDWAWADLYARHGLHYYPKLLSALPFTPITGHRLLGVDQEARLSLLRAALAQSETDIQSSLHVLFPTESEREWMKEEGCLIREGVQFHWHNQEFRDFADFLASLNHDKRKKIRQERRRAATHALTYRWLDGHSASEADWAFFYRCYATTYALHRSTPYLTPAFFTRLATRAPQHVRLLLAEREGKALASAFFLYDHEALYGRYWGAREDVPFLHFEMCYYQAIEYCIDHGLLRFEGGAQGEHKLARGLQPVVTYSAHWIRDPRMRNALASHLARESAQLAAYVDELSERSPFRRPPLAQGG